MTSEQKLKLKRLLAKYNPFLSTTEGSPYYDMKPLISTAYKEGADYLLPLGKRSKGKSYATKELILWEAYNECEFAEWIINKKKVPKKRYQFAYIRRWDRDISEIAVRDYFADYIVKGNNGKNKIEEITDDEYNSITIYRGVLYFATDDGENITKGKEIGRVFAVNISSRYKSRMFPKIGNLVYEEFIPEKDVKFVSNEVSQFTSIVSTICRNDRVRIILIGNTFTRVNPYYQEWQLTKTLSQKPGTLEKYTIDTGDTDVNGNPILIKLMVEMTSADGIDDFTTIVQRNTIVHGGWDSDVQPHLPKDTSFEDYKVKYDVLLDDCGFCFRICLIVVNKEPALYVYPYTGNKEKIKRRITEEFSTSPFVTRSWDKVTKYDELCRNLAKNKKIMFNTNLTGTDFYTVIKQRGGL